MKHQFEVLRPDYSQLLTAMVIRKECREAVDHAAVKLLGYKTRYEPVSAANGVPIVFIAASFEREASSNFTKNPAQGSPLTVISRIIPHNGPFRTWFDAAIAGYHLNGLDQVGAGNWTWELMCFYGELFNGMGYRDFHHMHSPYLWGRFKPCLPINEFGWQSLFPPTGDHFVQIPGDRHDTPRIRPNSPSRGRHH